MNGHLIEIQPLHNGKSFDGWIASLEPMEFYLHYDGPLPANPKNPSRVKNCIRQKLHPQLRALWGKEQILRSLCGSTRLYRAPDGNQATLTGLQFHSERFVRRDYKFAPLVCDDFGTICHLEILFFRREDNRALITKPKDEYGGDLDNRLKIFFDCLKVPDENQLDGLALPSNEPVFCLVQDDSLITKFQLDSAYLLEPAESGDDTEVRLLVKVRTKVARLGQTTMGYETRFFA
jgi:hypothetical protein